MSWKPIRRTVPSVSKVKLSGEPLLPEPADDMTPRNGDYVSDTLEHVGEEGDLSYPVSEFLSSFTVASHDVEKKYLNKFNKETKKCNFKGKTDLENTLCSGVPFSETSSWDSSVASFMSWNEGLDSEATKETKQLLDDIDFIIYGDGPASIEDEDFVAECLRIKERSPYFRVLGKRFKSAPELPSKYFMEEEQPVDRTEEIIMSHGVMVDECQQSQRKKCIVECIEDSQDEGKDNLLDKVRKVVLQQLSCYVLSEVMQNEKQAPVNSAQFGTERKQQVSICSSDKSSVSRLSEDLNGVLTISRKSLHQSPRKSSSKTSENYFETRAVKQSGSGDPKRFLSSTQSARKANHEPELSFSVLGVPKPLNCEPINSNIRAVDPRGFHSAADRRKSGFWERRFSCVSVDNQSVLKPLEERGGSAWSPATRVVNTQQAPVTSIPKLQRHLTLPPINNAETNNRGMLSPLPHANKIPSERISHLQLVKELLEKMPDRPSWGSGNRINLPDTRDPNRWKRSKVRNVDNI